MLKVVIKQRMATRLGKADFKIAENNFKSGTSMRKSQQEKSIYTQLLRVKHSKDLAYQSAQTYLLTIPVPKNPF